VSGPARDGGVAGSGVAALPSFWKSRHTIALQYIARLAAEAILKTCDDGACAAEPKADGSPVTAADSASQKVILDGLRKLTPDIPIVSEEQDNPASLASGGTFWLVDPLDGTREFVDGGIEYTINISLLTDFQPCVGLIYSPAEEELYYGDASGVLHITSGEQIFVEAAQAKTAGPARILSSRREAPHLPLDAWKGQGLIASSRLCSSALKFGLLAIGEADIYVRPGRTFEWDTAAGDAILRALGGGVVTLDGGPLRYGKAGFQNDGFVAYGPTYRQEGLEAFLEIVRAVSE